MQPEFPAADVYIIKILKEACYELARQAGT